MTNQPAPMQRFDFVRLSTLSAELPYTYQALQYHVNETELLPAQRSEKGAVLVPRDFAMRVVEAAPNFDTLTQLLSAINHSYNHVAA